jgi:hypothetical protein
MLPGGCWQRRGAAQGQLTSERDTEGLVAERCSFCALTQGCRDCTSWRQGLRQACLRQRPGDSETRAKFGAHRRTRGCCAMCTKCALPERPQRGAMYWGFGATSWGGGALGRASHRGTAKPSHGPWDLGDRRSYSPASRIACFSLECVRCEHYVFSSA